jgi:hypothetical protein
VARRRGVGNPKKHKSARRRRPPVSPTAAPPIPERLRAEALLTILRDKDAATAPIFLAAGLWMLHGTFVGHTANHCLDACITLRHVYEHFGIESRVELVQVEVDGAGGPTRHGAAPPRWNPDGTLNGHAVLFLPNPRLLVDATLPQFREVPADSLIGQVIPVVMRLPDGVHFDGQDAIALARDDHTVAYLPAIGTSAADLLVHPALREAEPVHRQAACNVASKTVAMLSTGELAELFPRARYLRLQRLIDELRDAKLVERGEDFVFRRPTGVEVRLPEIA